MCLNECYSMCKFYCIVKAKEIGGKISKRKIKCVVMIVVKFATVFLAKKGYHRMNTGPPY